MRIDPLSLNYHRQCGAHKRDSNQPLFLLVEWRYLLLVTLCTSQQLYSRPRGTHAMTGNHKRDNTHTHTRTQSV